MQPDAQCLDATTYPKPSFCLSSRTFLTRCDVMQYATWCDNNNDNNNDVSSRCGCGQAKQLAADGHLCYATCSTLESELLGMDPASLLPYNEGKPELFATYLDGAMGFK